MTAKLIFSLTLITSIVTSVSAYAAGKKNQCDVMEEKNFPENQVEQCRKSDKEGYGESEYFKKEQQKKKWQEVADQQKVAQELAKKSNVEILAFSQEDIEKAADTFGAPIYAFTEDRNFKSKKITNGDDLCSMLGFEKSIKIRVSSALIPDENEQGFVIDKLTKKKTIYKKGEDAVSKFVGITCGKVISKDIKGTKELLKEMNEEVEHVTDYSPSDISHKSVDDRSRSKDSKIPTPMRGYEREYKDVEKQTSGK